ncbi:hypothetical protein KFL_001450150 [Klebsormidium nitens]|uniref:Secreted protein n=1 Tax=Klebsormidium nitens TaxID=105231 RepID=A0A1Y1I060_KLENI|nr:hypothetical protein KFL_001450150 [Klebsormidium nitens]|eukprot:GAQ83362.1 hypothetical protein KFL_001450150 [Klebsormidium nitens]
MNAGLAWRWWLHGLTPSLYLEELFLTARGPIREQTGSLLLVRASARLAYALTCTESTSFPSSGAEDLRWLLQAHIVRPLRVHIRQRTGRKQTEDAKSTLTTF